MDAQDVHILLVEDDSTARMLLADVLIGAGYRVMAAPDGNAAFDALKQSTLFDVVITDIRMGEVDGIQVLHRAREHEHPPAVILLTGYGSLDTAIAALRAGAFDYLLKPVAPRDLLERVQKAVERHRAETRQNNAVRIIAQGLAQLQSQQPADPGAASQPDEQTGTGTGTTTRDNDADAPHGPRYIHVGKLVIDTFRHTVSFDGQSLHLTPIEYALLSCLAESHGRVVSYQQIVQATHGHDADESEAQSLLKAHVRNMRRKIDSAYLVNVRGIGYMLTNPDQPDV